MNKNWVLLIAFLSVVSLLSGCATRPMSSGRRGLLDRDGYPIVRSSGAEAEEAANDMYAPKEGSKVELTGKWQWPLKHVTISSNYGDRGAKFHQGVDLRAAYGTPVLAAADGEVVYVGSKIRGYGRMVVLKHKDNFYSVYAHHSRNSVKLGKHVKRGQIIAYSGKSGHATGPHLHFEIRRGTQSFDPDYALNANINDLASNRKVASDKN
ncbi:MAG: M23 family metallopeptidase [Bdellovibrionales bacterium]|nr:M23 family metallopeptidase [Bdellovibrionales bacterium]